MAKIVNAGLLTMSAISNGLLNQQTLKEIKTLNTQFTNSLGNVSDWFKERSLSAFETFGGERVRDRIQGLMRKNELFWESNTIRPLETIAEIQHAPEAMYEWLACHPDLGKRIQHQQAHGWGCEYLRTEDHGDDNHLYRVLYHGASQEFEDGSEGWVMYFDEPEDEEHLTLTQRLDIMRSHQTIDELMEGDRDITDPMNGRW